MSIEAWREDATSHVDDFDRRFVDSFLDHGDRVASETHIQNGIDHLGGVDDAGAPHDEVKHPRFSVQAGAGAIPASEVELQRTADAARAAHHDRSVGSMFR
jgi:hypothetical protein